MKRKKSAASIFPRWTRIVAGILWLGLILYGWTQRDILTVEGVLNASPSDLWLAVAFMLLLFALKSISIVFYCGVLYIASGILFSLPLAILVNLTGTVIMASLPYWLGRYIGPSLVERIHEAYPKTVILQQFRSKNSFVTTLLLRAISILPLDVVSMYLGAARTPYSWYLMGSITGMLTSCILFPILGENIEKPGSWQFILAASIEITIILISITITVCLNRKALKEKRTGK